MTLGTLVLNGILLGAALAVDAFSVSVANAINEAKMPGKRAAFIAAVFGVFQALMPMAGWVCVRFVASIFSAFEKWIPWIAALLLFIIGVKMIMEGIKHPGEDEVVITSHAILFAQGVATSIDALSVGFAIAGLSFPAALAESLIIGLVTFGICLTGLFLGKKLGAAVRGRASVLGGLILIFIGIMGLIR